MGVPEVRSGSRDLHLLGLLGGLWLAVWLVLRTAAWVAGGAPSASPLDLVNPARLIKQLQADRGTLVWWHLVGAYGRIHPWTFWLSITSLALIILAVPAVARWCLAGRDQRIHHIAADRGLRRASRWATRGDLRTLRVRRAKRGCFTLGKRGRRLLATEPETSVLVVGPTRSGKTTGLVIPSLFEWAGPAVVTSTKSELIDITAGQRQSVGPVYVYDPTGDNGRYRSISWSPLAGCEDLDRAWLVATWLCTGLQQSGHRSDSDWAHWAESGKLLIAPLLFVAASHARTILDVCGWIHSFDLATPMGLIEDMFMDPGRISGDAARASSMLQAIDQRPEKERGTVFSTVMRIFNVFNESPVAASAMACQLDPDDFLRRRGTLYLCTPRQSPERISSLFIGFLMSIITAAYAGSDRSRSTPAHGELGLFLDELANVVPIEDLPSLASQGAGRGVLLMSITQDLSQLRSRYGQERAYSILNNHACKVILPGISDPETNDVLSRIIGRGEFTEVAVNRGVDGRIGRTFSTRHDPMATPDAIRQLRAGTAIVIHKGRPPAIIRLRPWYADRRIRRLADRAYLKNANYAMRPS